jgi:ubiquinone/menaquinone biosynthesis C-methylase UbiE
MNEPDLEALKARMKATWESGDYGQFAKYLEKGALEFFDRLSLVPGSKILDIGCGAGQLTIPAAQRWFDVTGIDLAQNLVDQANERAKSVGLILDIRQGDAESLPFPDNSFDAVFSLIGSMFAPRPELVATEMVRVCRPHGKVIMGNWTPEGVVGKLFKIVADFRPLPPNMASPLLWGDEKVVRDRFANLVSDLTVTKYLYPFKFPFKPSEVADQFIKFNGPFLGCYKRLDDDGKIAFREALTGVFSGSSKTTNGTTEIDAEYVEVIGTKI